MTYNIIFYNRFGFLCNVYLDSELGCDMCLCQYLHFFKLNFSVRFQVGEWSYSQMLWVLYHFASNAAARQPGPYNTPNSNFTSLMWNLGKFNPAPLININSINTWVRNLERAEAYSYASKSQRKEKWIDNGLEGWRKQGMGKWKTTSVQVAVSLSLLQLLNAKCLVIYEAGHVPFQSPRWGHEQTAD